MDGVIVAVHGNADYLRSLIEALRGAGADVIGCATARAALNTCCALEPSCLVTDARLPDESGGWLAAQLRAQAGRVAATPIVALGADASAAARREILSAGADVFVRGNVLFPEIVTSVEALLAMATRLREKPASSSTIQVPEAEGHGQGTPRNVAEVASPMTDAAPSLGRPLSGATEKTSIATVLAILELERASGELRLSIALSGRPRMILDVASGAVLRGRAGAMTHEPLAAVTAALHWGPGRFEFAPGPLEPAPSSALRTSQLLRAIVETVEAGPPTEIDAPPTTRPRALLSELPPNRVMQEKRAKPAHRTPRTVDRPRPDVSKGSTLVSIPAVRSSAPAKRRMSELVQAVHVDHGVARRVPPPAPTPPPVAKEPEPETEEPLDDHAPTTRNPR